MEKVPQYNEREPSAQAMTDQEMTPDKETLRPCPSCGVTHLGNCQENIKFFSSDTTHYYLIEVKELDSLRAENEKLKLALNKICSVTQFDHPISQIIGSEEYEGAWLDCVEIAKEALACSK